ncbi:fungal-specific transcription factor domain-containing protein [Rhizoctonia solani]|nr:fungal-specific transcription factor domain-containing protein [Rhizoctonia solani]
MCYFYSTFLSRIFYDYALIPGSLVEWIYQRFNTSNTSKYAMLATAALFRSDYERSIMTTSWRACAKELYSLAIRQLSHDLEKVQLSLQEKLTGLVEVMNYEYYAGRLSDYYSHGILTVPLVKAIMGAETLDLLNIRGIDMFNVNFWAWCDILDSMATSRPTWFKYESDLDRAVQPGTEESGASEDKGIEWIYGCPNIIAVILARTSSLRHAKLSVEEKRSQGIGLEQLIKSWQLRPLGAKESLLRVTRMGTQEVWRHAGILYVHHAILKSNSNHLVIRDSVKSIIKIASTLKPGGNPDSFLAVPYFIAGFYAANQKDRYILKSRLIGCGNGHFLRNLVNNLDEL